MSSYTKMSLLQLQKSLANVEKALTASSPELFTELRLIDRLIATKRHGEPGMFTHVRSIVQAIEVCFDTSNTWMSRADLEEMLIAGGYPLAHDTAKGLLRDTLNYHVKKGRIARNGEEFGRPEWMSREDYRKAQ